MAYYLETDDRELLKKLRLTNVCSECKGELEGFYSMEKHLPYLQCKSNPEHEGIAKPYHEPPTLDEYNINTRREKMNKELGENKATALAKFHDVSTMTREIATEIVGTLWGDAPAIEKTKAIILCHTYNLNPLMRHLHLVKFKKWDRDHKKVIGEDWSMMMGIQAKRLLAQRKHNFSYLDMSPRSMTEEEQIKVFGKKQNGFIMSITILKDMDTGATAQGFGRIKVGERVKGEEKGNSPEHMSQIRSESQTLERLYPGEMPQGVEVIDEAYVQLPDGRKVGEETGEIIEAEFKEVKEEKLEPPAPTKLEGEEPDIRDETPISEEQIIELGDLAQRNGIMLADIVKWCLTVKDWTVGKLGDLKVWQYNEIVESFEKDKLA